MANTEDKVAKIRAKYGVPEGFFVAPGASGYVTFDGHFVTLSRVGLSRLTVGKGDKRIAVTSITGVQLKPAGALVNGFIQFTIPGGVERRSSFFSQTVRAAEDENSMVFIKTDEAAFLQLRDHVEEAQYNLSRPPGSVAPAVSVPAGPDIMAQLQQLGQLRDAGVLTEEEFASKKAELLSRL